MKDFPLENAENTIHVHCLVIHVWCNAKGENDAVIVKEFDTFAV